MLGPTLRRFYLNVRQGDEVIADREGMLLEDVGDAITEALVCAQMDRAARNGSEANGRIFEIRDNEGKSGRPFRFRLKKTAI
ncbi:hypothetical protein QTL95_17710 [Rhizobium sp. S152]|uniref:DUF6894 family protein n=1 Tax=Rhizobium sp. S152 TaxID=3055038 RepID=UPI0025A99A3D|nr:hypothetical protein [Rhizobium sp. S152]MDM9627735.1 hypothetical protein [Rhizobium sp. S152]